MARTARRGILSTNLLQHGSICTKSTFYRADQKRAKRRRFENLLKGEFFSTVTMVTMHDRGKQSPSGSRYVQARKHRLLQMGSKPTHTKLGENQRVASKRKFGIIKVRQTSGNTINLSDPKTKKTITATIKLVTGNPANRHFVRRNIITKGTILDTDKGKARVTSLMVAV